MPIRPQTLAHLRLQYLIEYPFHQLRQSVFPFNNPGNNSLPTLISYPVIASAPSVDQRLRTVNLPNRSGGCPTKYLQQFTDSIKINNNGNIPLVNLISSVGVSFLGGNGAILGANKKALCTVGHFV